MSAGTETAARRYAAYLERIAADNLAELEALTAPDVHFKDPFNDVKGQARMIRVFAEVFAVADDVRFEVSDLAFGDRLAFILWDFSCRPKRGGGTWTFRGVSEVRLDGEGRVVEHIDHFDAGSQLYAKLPLVGPLVRFVRRRLEVRDDSSEPPTR